jgi:hypothetical protein
VALLPANSQAAFNGIRGVTSYQPGGGGNNGPDAFAFGPGTPYTVQDCLNQMSGGATSCSQPIVVAATPDGGVADLLKGVTLTWDQASTAYGLPAGTTYIVCDKYANGVGDGTFDVSVCHVGQTCRNNPNTAPSLNTAPAVIGMGSCSTAGAPSS